MLLRRLVLAALLSLMPAAALTQSAAPAASAAPADPPAPAPTPGWLYRDSDLPPDPAWVLGTLDNGVRYAVRRNLHPERQVSIRVRIEAGSLNESPAQQGWAHLVEHLAFRATSRFADREARHIWQRLGASFGSDSNAFTGLTQTVYQLDLPNADEAGLGTSLDVLSDMMAGALFEPAAVDAERQIVIAEKERRSELAVRVGDAGRALFFNGMKIATQETIGTEATLNAATPEALREFYRRWYRPERATIIMVGDMDTERMIQLIRQRFGNWQGHGEAPAEADYGALADPPARIDSVVYPGAPTEATIGWVRPYTPPLPNRERERGDLEQLLASSILNRRLERHARGDSAFIRASIGLQRARGMAEVTRLSVGARNDGWQAAVEQAFAIIGDGLRAPPSAAEIAREIANLRTSAEASVQGEATISSQAWASGLINALDSGDVMVSAPVRMQLLEDLAPQMTPERIGAAMRALFTGSGPRMLLLSPQPIEGGTEALAAGLARAEQAQPAVRGDDRLVSFDTLPPLGRPGRVVSRRHLDDLGVTIVRFANGSTLTFKQTRFEEGRVLVRLRFGRGLSGLPADRPNLAWASGVVAPSGLADLDLDSLERLLTGRRIGMGFSVGEDAYVLGGTTRAEDLGDQLRLLATKLTHPRWDPALFRRFQTNAIQAYELQFATASARASRELAGFTHPGDARWQAFTREQLDGATSDTLRAFFEPRLREGPVHAVIVGDVDLAQAIETTRRTIGALPRRTTPRPASDPRRVLPPQPAPEPTIFTHNGDPAQAYAVIGWSTIGGAENLRARRALTLAASIFQIRLFDRLREEEGASYAPSAVQYSTSTFPNYGIFYAGSEIRPDRVPVFFRLAREIAADLAARPVPDEEFARAQNPIISGIERRLSTNGYWLEAIESFAERPADIEAARAYLSDYRSLTPAEVQRAFAAHVTEQGDWSMVVLPAREPNGAE